MKQIKKWWIAVTLMPLLTGCTLDFSSYLNSSPIDDSGSYTIPIGSETVGGSYIPASLRYDYRDVKLASYTQTLPSTGIQKVLVLPVEFTDYPASALDNQGGEKTLSNIQKAFFGDASVTSWHSVSSFYQDSSYDHLTITGTVLDWFNINMSAATLATKTSYNDPTYQVLELFYNSASSELLQEYDQNNDGFIDALWLIYSIPARAVNEDLYWAYTYWYDQAPKTSKPVPGVYAWASYDFMYEGYGSNGIDAHTYIHETGHVLGLDDYYNYDEDSTYGPTGRVDMMDWNIVDHNAFSKMALGWTLPHVIDGSEEETTIMLSPFESSGDVILINDTWNGSPFDEYIAIEFYTPTGLNQKDSLSGGYPGNNLSGFTIPGVKIFHVDARLVFGYRVAPWNWASYQFTDNIRAYNGSSYTDVGQSNTPSKSTEEDYRLLHLMEATGTNSFASGNKATNATLFTEGQSFTPSTVFFENGSAFNDGSPVGYRIEIGDITLAGAMITIVKI